MFSRRDTKMKPEGVKPSHHCESLCLSVKSALIMYVNGKTEGGWVCLFRFEKA